MKKILIFSIFAIILAGCTPRPRPDNNTLYVSILPLRTIVKGIVGDDFRVEVLVPPGASPETFEPTPKQYIDLNEARLVFNVGLIDFETALLAKIDTSKVVNLSQDIPLIAGSCSHSNHGQHHAHGIDPHVWTSPRALRTMAANAYNAICRAYPDSVKYTTNYHALDASLAQLDTDIAARFAESRTPYFLIYHPALTYYARDYGVEQVAIESEGKEPSAKRLGQIIGRARQDGTKRIFYQSQFPASTVEIIARDIKGIPVEIDPLREDVIENIRHITDLITTP